MRRRPVQKVVRKRDACGGGAEMVRSANYKLKGHPPEQPASIRLEAAFLGAADGVCRSQGELLSSLYCFIPIVASPSPLRPQGQKVRHREEKEKTERGEGAGNRGKREIWINHDSYKEKMKEISVLSLICSCLYPETRKNIMGDFEDMDIKPINKRASGQAFEVILKPPSPVSDVAHCVTSPPKRDISLEDIQKKLEAAEDRRRSQEAQVLQALAEKREHERDVLLKAMEENNNFSRMAEEKLQMKMEQIEENRMAYLAAIMERLQEKTKMRVGGRGQNILREEDRQKNWIKGEITAKVKGGKWCREARPGGAQEQGVERRANSMRSPNRFYIPTSETPPSPLYHHPRPLRNTPTPPNPPPAYPTFPPTLLQPPPPALPYSVILLRNYNSLRHHPEAVGEARVVFNVISTYWNHCTSLQDTVNTTASGSYITTWPCIILGGGRGDLESEGASERLVEQKKKQRVGAENRSSHGTHGASQAAIVQDIPSLLMASCAHTEGY
ncbi:unnamed protein product [Pleuronectes platessa]|uniref:Stathmin-2 n=1 Tax=Pleuronectes platessa TaxID=8262 RepID=A0A9N7Z672_PLEPL|nr:unnamed protein product [Pleuronectes platessa]